MNNWQKYKQLTADIRRAKAFLDNHEKKITSQHDVYDLNGENPSETCINVYDRVKLPDGQINDEGGFTENCKYLNNGETFCDNWENCDFAKQFDRFCYCKLKQEYDDAVAARRKFVRKLFKFKARWKLLKRYSRHVDVAWQKLNSAEQAITCNVTEYHLEPGQAVADKKCINKFNKVVVDSPETKYVDDTGVISYCNWFKSGTICANPEGCEYKSAQAAYDAARAEYDKAVAAKWDWVFGRQSKQQ